MTYKEVLAEAMQSIESLDAEVLLAHVLGVSREYIIVHKSNHISLDDGVLFRNLVDRRIKNEPLAYIIQKKEFYGREFFVNQHVLIPRPETEELIDLLLLRVQNKTLRVVDVGTGSGCIAITLSMEGFLHVSASDISHDALQVAQKNAQMYKREIVWKEGCFLEPYQEEKIDILIANLPYVPQSSEKNMMKDVLDYEPHLALFGGENGDQCYYDLICDIQKHPEIQYCFFEVDHTHAYSLLATYRENIPFLHWEIKQDLSQKNRFLYGEKF